jgi:hypothetical protein
LLFPIGLSQVSQSYIDLNHPNYIENGLFVLASFMILENQTGQWVAGYDLDFLFSHILTQDAQSET